MTEARAKGLNAAMAWFNAFYAGLAEGFDLSVLVARTTSPQEAADCFMTLSRLAALSRVRPNEGYLAAMDGTFLQGWEYIPERIRRAWLAVCEEERRPAKPRPRGRGLERALAQAAALLGVTEAEVLARLEADPGARAMARAMMDSEPVQ